MQRLLAIAAFLLAACGDTVPVDEIGNGQADEAAEANGARPVAVGAVPVRIGELGSSFNACGGAGTTRNLRAGEGLELRAAPFDSAALVGAVPAGSQFFICSRSHDQRWMGIVFDESGTLGPGCGVSAPVRTRRAYDGPCRSGWVSSAFVKLISGVESPATIRSDEESGNGAQTSGAGA